MRYHSTLHSTYRLLSIFLLISVLAACGRTPEEEPAVANDEDADLEVPAHSMPSQRTETLVVEGEPQEVTLRLFESPESPILIYYPEGDFSASEVRSSQAYGAHLVSSFGGTRNEDAWIRFYFPHPGSRQNSPEALQMLIEEEDGIADIEGFQLSPAGGDGGCPGNARAWTIVSRNQSGGICIGSRDDRYFLMVATYPPEFGDGFGPRHDLILRHTYWRDTEQPVFATAN
jgi:hypothetical protein